MPPVVKSLANRRIDRSTILLEELGPDGIPGVLLGPGVYTLRNVLDAPSLPNWGALPVTGHVHVAYNGPDLVETWVLLATYRPVRLTPQDSVLVACVSEGPPGPVGAFLDALRPSNPGAVVCTWSHAQPSNLVAGHGTPEAASASVRARMAPTPARNPAQCMPGEVEIVATDPAGVLGPILGTVSVTGPGGGVWQAGQFVEGWCIGSATHSLLGQQAALLRPAHNPPPTSGPSQVLWNVAYAPL